MVAVPAYAGEDLAPNLFVRMAKKSKEGMVSKQEVMKMVEKMFDKHDTMKRGMLDKQQADAFFKELMKGGDGA